MDFSTTKYIIHAEIVVDGYVEKNDIIGAIFGQTEGLLGDELDLRDLQKSGRIGRIDVNIEYTNGKSIAKLEIPSSLDRVETSIIAATLETVDKVGPCTADVRVLKIEDIRERKRKYITERAKEILKEMNLTVDINAIIEEVKESVRMSELIYYGEEKLPAGPLVDSSEEIIIVEGKADVLNLLRYGIRNVIAVEGTSIPKTIIELSKRKITTLFTDGDRGGELILKEALQVCDIDYIARAPKGREVEELTRKEIIKCLKNRVPISTKNYSCEENNEDIKEDDLFDTLKILSNLKDKAIIVKDDEKITVNVDELIEKIEEFNKVDCLYIEELSQKLLDNIYQKVDKIYCKLAKVTKVPINVTIIGGFNAKR
ncbi:DNA primase DnaG [Methanocaldococcus indicus]|uniref:DNA primase DnaG n=1 Tax=Methanocaldococcus indicus TaxID=213231 RepID=UPI003C6D2D31